MKRTSTIVAIVSGKGGVGKTVLAVNLAEALAAAGRRVALVDADLGQGGCAILVNEAPAASVLDVALRTATPAQATLQTDAGLTLVQAVAEAGQADGRENLLYEALDAHLQRLRTRHEVVLIDAPAGTDGAVRWALDRADLGVLTLVGEPTAVADAYRLAKLIWTNDASYPLATLVNHADSADDAQSVADRFGEITNQFLHRRPTYLGWVPFSAQIRASVMQQTPAVRTPGPVRDAFADLVRVLTEGRQADELLAKPSAGAAIETLES